MSRKHLIKSFLMFDGADLTTSPTSSETNVKNVDKASIFLSWSGTSPVATLTVEATNDDPSNGQPATWRALDFGSVINITGNTGDHDIVLNEMPFQAIRLVVAFTSGTGTVTANISAKTVGA